MRSQSGFSGDGGPADQAALDEPWDLLADSAGNLLIADTNNNRIRKIDARTGIITTIAGSGPVNGWERYHQGGGYCGDGGPATQACLNTPFGIALDKEGNLFIAEGSGPNRGGRIRKVDRNGTIQTFVQGHFATKIAFDDAGNLYAPLVYEWPSIVRISPDGSINWIAGSKDKDPGFSGDGGPALNAQLLLNVASAGLAIDGQGNLFFDDGANRRIRAVKFGALIAPPNATITVTSGAPQAVPVNTALRLPLEAQVLDASGHPAVGVRVDFSAPASGPSCVFPNGSATLSVRTNPAGVAQASCTASNNPGAYAVIATPLASMAAARFGLSNIPPGGSGGVPQAVSVIPAAGTWAYATYTFTFSDSAGWQNISVANILINNFIDGRNACYVAVVPASSSVFLVDDAGDAGGPYGPENSQCIIGAAGASITGSGNTLTIALPITFKPAFAGNKLMYLAARESAGANSGWQALGTCGIPGANPVGPAAGGVTPARSTGPAAQSFTFTFTDTNGWQDLGVVNVLINDALDGNHACYLAYSRPYNTLYLVNDAGTALSNGLSNSQCTVAAGWTASGTGNTLTLTLNLTFPSSFAGNRIIYAAARSNGDVLNSGLLRLASGGIADCAITVT